jgi:hypothetical protein
MTKYLISFPSRAMELADDEWELVGRESHAVVQQAKDAGVWVFGGGIEERGPGPCRGRRHRQRGRLPRERAALRRVRRPRAPVARRCTGVGGTLRRLLPVPARGVGVHVRPGVLSRPVAGHRSPPTRECQRTTRASLRRRTSAPTIAPSPTTTVIPPRPTPAMSTQHLEEAGEHLAVVAEERVVAAIAEEQPWSEQDEEQADPHDDGRSDARSIQPSGPKRP